jgi:hypothetical protein
MTSNERSFPWDDHNGDREYSSDEFAEFFSTLFKPGVVATANFGTGLQITESASLGMRVKFCSGEAFSSFGRNYVHGKDEEVIVPIASTLQDRTDSVAIQFNKSQRDAFFVYKESDTTVTRTDSIFELQIAKILVPKNSTQITNANITDMRADESVCGYFSPHGKLNTGDITAQFVAWFNDFKGKLGTDPATNLQLQITDLDSKVVHKTGDETISGKKTFSEVVDMPKFADSYVAFFANKGGGNTVTFTAPWDCTAEVELFYHGWGYGGGEWEIGITTPSGLTQIYEATGYTKGHDTQAMAMHAKAIYSGLKKGQQYTFDKRDVGGRPGGASRPMMIVKLYRN